MESQAQWKMLLLEIVPTSQYPHPLNKLITNVTEMQCFIPHIKLPSNTQKVLFCLRKAYKKKLQVSAAVCLGWMQWITLEAESEPVGQTNRIALDRQTGLL